MSGDSCTSYKKFGFETTASLTKDWGKAFDATLSTTASSSESTASGYSITRQSILVEGGSSELFESSGFTAWAQTVNENPQIVKTGNLVLVGLWQAVADPKLKENIHTSVMQYLNNQASSFQEEFGGLECLQFDYEKVGKKCKKKKKGGCFSGDSTVTLESGKNKPLSSVSVGDRILSADINGKLSFSDVVFIPHQRNTVEASFVDITTHSGKFLRATPMHLIVTCDSDLVYASALGAGTCLLTIDGEETVATIKTSNGQGIYTAVVLSNEYLVVGGVVASPFEVAHGVANAYYNIHRFIYQYAPLLVESHALASANAFITSVAVSAASLLLSASSGK
jgi:hypothetical protein